MDCDKAQGGERGITNSVEAAGAAAQRNEEMLRALGIGGAGAALPALGVDVHAPERCEDGGDASTACCTALNLLARFLPRVRYSGDPSVPLGLPASVRALVKDEGPLGPRAAPVSLVFGTGPAPRAAADTVYVGSAGWSSYVSRKAPCEWVDQGPAGMGAVTAGALAAGEAFKRALPEADTTPVDHLVYDLVTHGAAQRPVLLPDPRPRVDVARMAVVGCGAIGQAACMSLLALRLAGTVVLIDPDEMDASNEQRCVWASKETRGRPKAEHCAGMLKRANPGLEVQHFQDTYERVAEAHRVGAPLDAIAVCVDNVETRVNVQGALPRAVWNGWTDTRAGSLGYGVSRHAYDGGHACVSCYYKRSSGTPPSADEVAAARTGIPAEEIGRMRRTGAACTMDHIWTVSRRTGLPVAYLQDNLGSPVSQLLHGACGVFRLAPLAGAHAAPRAPTPAPHQSLLAGVHLAAQVVLSRMQLPPGARPVESAAEFDALHLPGPSCLYRAPREAGCACSDPVYLAAYEAKWGLDGGARRGTASAAAAAGPPLAA